MSQFFKGDATELKYYNSGLPISDILSGQKSEFFEECYGCYVLGEMLYDNNYAPLSNAIPREIFRTSFATIFNSFLEAGSFESFISVFKNVFGEDVQVTFEVPAPGKLNIDIVATGLEIYGTLLRVINNVNDTYDYFTMIDDEGDRIVLQAVKGFESQYELEQMLREMVSGGIFTNINLTVGA